MAFCQKDVKLPQFNQSKANALKTLRWITPVNWTSFRKAVKDWLSQWLKTKSCSILVRLLKLQSPSSLFFLSAKCCYVPAARGVQIYKYNVWMEGRTLYRRLQIQKVTFQSLLYSERTTIHLNTSSGPLTFTITVWQLGNICGILSSFPTWIGETWVPRRLSKTSARSLLPVYIHFFTWYFSKGVSMLAVKEYVPHGCMMSIWVMW